MEFSNVASYQRFLAIAAKIERDPALLEIPLANMDRWIANGIDGQHRLEQWRQLILAAQSTASGMEILLAVLHDDGEEARHLKSYSPFAGVLTSKERQALILETCSFHH